MASFIEKLLECCKSNNSLLCVGLDIDLAQTPPHVAGEANSILAFNQAIIDATADLVCAYKPNLAFYEALGMDGIDALRRTLRHIPAHIPVIGDAKRSDVGHSAKAYAKACFEVVGFDAVTVNPYLGRDSLQPFIDYRDKGIFVLCKTSNPGSGDFQDIGIVRDSSAASQPLFEVVARAVSGWNIYGNCGLVVGATYPEQLRTIRQIVPDMPLLIPGAGTQAGNLEKSVQYGIDAKGELAIINSSRQIIYASREKNFALAAREAAESLRDAINQARKSKGQA